MSKREIMRAGLRFYFALFFHELLTVWKTERRHKVHGPDGLALEVFGF
jgi:hypothetical protein